MNSNLCYHIPRRDNWDDPCRLLLEGALEPPESPFNHDPFETEDPSTLATRVIDRVKEQLQTDVLVWSLLDNSAFEGFYAEGCKFLD